MSIEARRKLLIKQIEDSRKDIRSDRMDMGNCTEDEKKQWKAILKKYGFHIMQGDREYITANELRKINKRYSIERAFQLTKVTPVKRPQLIIGG